MARILIIFRLQNIWKEYRKYEALRDQLYWHLVMGTGKWVKVSRLVWHLNLEKAMSRSLSSTSLASSWFPLCFYLLLMQETDDVVTTTINTLTTLSRSGKRPAFGAIFLLNNISYFRTHVLLEPADPALISFLSKPAIDILNSNFRTARAAYFDANFSPLMQALTDDPSGKGSTAKAATKEKFIRFFDLLDEITERHRMAKVLEDDRDGRETVSEEVVKLIVPALKKFTQKHRDKEFSKSASTCVLSQSNLLILKNSQILRNVSF
jgi:hypothetical protein